MGDDLLKCQYFLIFYFVIRFNEEGEELKENGEKSTEPEQTKTKEETTTEETKPKLNGDSAAAESETVKENGVSSAKEEAATEVKSEVKTENSELGKLLMFIFSLEFIPKGVFK